MYGDSDEEIEIEVVEDKVESSVEIEAIGEGETEKKEENNGGCCGGCT